MHAMVWSIATFAVMSFVCAFAWDYQSLLVFRLIQGIGLGGEVPVAAVYISELTRARHRGRFVLLYELVFPIGLVGASLLGLWVVPTLGWQWMFYIGALPALLALVLRLLLPESPRWLAVHGRHSEAEAALSMIEQRDRRDRPDSRCRRCSRSCRPEIERASLADLFGPHYLRRTLVVWVIWFSAYFVNYGLAIWLPTIYRTVFKLPLDVSLRYGLITQAVGLHRHADLRVDASTTSAAASGLRSPSPPPLQASACSPPSPSPEAMQVLTYMTHRLFLRQHHQSRRLPLHAGALPDAGARARRRHRDRVAAPCLDDRSDRGRLHDRRRAAIGVRGVRRGGRDRRHHHRGSSRSRPRAACWRRCRPDRPT